MMCFRHPGVPTFLGDVRTPKGLLRIAQVPVHCLFTPPLKDMPLSLYPTYGTCPLSQYPTEGFIRCLFVRLGRCLSRIFQADPVYFKRIRCRKTEQPGGCDDNPPPLLIFPLAVVPLSESYTRFFCRKTEDVFTWTSPNYSINK